MKRKLQFCLAVILGLTASVGWFHAKGDPEQQKDLRITTDLVGAQVGKSIVFGVSTFPTANVTTTDLVRIEIGLKGANASTLKDWKMEYYEPNSPNPDWMTWNAENNTYVFGPATGFPLKTATSYFKITPTTKGTFEYTLTVKKVSDNTIVAADTYLPSIEVADAFPIYGYGVASIGEQQYASLNAAVHFAAENNTINLSPGNFNSDPGTKTINGMTGWYLPIDKKGLTIIGSLSGNNPSSQLSSSVKTQESTLPTQDYMAIFSDNVTLKNLIILGKNEANKTIEVFGKNLTAENVQFTYPNSWNANYSGSLYFNPSNTEKDAGTVSLKMMSLYNGRITFSGAEKGTITMEDIRLSYRDMLVAAHVMENKYELQSYTPFGSINKAGLKINVVNNVVAYIEAPTKAEYYQLDANTVANMPAGSLLTLGEGTFKLTSPLEITKPMSIQGTKGTILEPATSWKDAKNLVTVKGAGVPGVSVNGKDNQVTIQSLIIQNSNASGINAQSVMPVLLQSITLTNNAHAGLLVHSSVKAEGLTTTGNKWGGVNIDKGTPAYAPFFEFDATSTLAEQSKIWSEDITSDAETLVKVPNDTWSSYVGIQGTNANKMRYWTNSALRVDNFTAFPNKPSWEGDYTFVYANGNPITIEEGSTPDKVKISIDGTTEVLELDVASRPTIFGGSKNETVKKTKITMKSGKISSLFGGGYGESNGNESPATATPAAVTDSTIIVVTGGEAHNIFGGGLYYSKSNKVNITVNNVKMDKNAWLICGGLESGLTTAGKYPVFDKCSNTVNEGKLTINGGTFCYIGIGGTDGYGGYVKTATAKISKASIVGLYGNGSNGASDKVTGTITECTFTKMDGGYTTEIAAINRGHVKDVTLAFDKCTFPTSDIVCNIGGIAGWKKDYKGSESQVVTPGTINYSFTGCTNTPALGLSDGLDNANVTIAGTSVKVASFNNGVDAAKTAFTISKDKTWSFIGGLTVASGSTLTNSGILAIPAADIMAGITAGGDLQVAATSKDILDVMNKADNKADLKDKVFTITCNDGVIAPTKEKAKELLKAGKNAMLLSFNEGTYSVAVYSIIQAKITNLPDSVVFGTQPITLAFNLANTVVTAKTNTDNAVKLENNILTILKPGIVTFELKVKKDTNNDGNIDDNDKQGGQFVYDEDAASTQTLKVTKRKVTLTEGLTATARDYDGGNTITLTKNTLKFAGKLGTDATGLDLATGFTGELQDANAGENKAVVVTATLAGNGSNDSTAYYELAPITFVKAKVNPKAVTVTAEAKTRNYGETNPEFTVSYSPALVSGDKLDGILKFNCTATKESLVKEGGYDIMPYGLTSNNYAITFAKGALTVEAVDPQIELVEAKTVINGANRDIQVKAKLIDKGGAAADATVTFKYGENGTANGTLTDGYYTATIANPGAADYAITASAKVGEKTGTSKGINVTIDAKKLQTVTFGKSVLPTMVYGNEIALAAISDQAAAKGEYTYKVESVTGTATITDGKLKATKAGKVTLTVTRAADADYSAASAIQTIEITPKPITVAVGEIQKAYDGTTTVTTLPTLTLAGVLSGDEATIKTVGLSLSYANKNAADRVNVLMPALVLEGSDAANYTLIQPTAVTGKITKAPLTVKVKDVTRMWNQRYTKYEFEATGLQNDEPLNVAYTGILNVSESGENLNLTMDQAKCPNYSIETQPGKLTVQMGNPTAVVYGVNSSANAVNVLLIDEAGYSGLTVEKVIEGDKVYAVIKSGDKTIAQSINNITIVTSPRSFSMPATKAAGDWNDASFKPIAFGTTGTETIAENATFMSSNPNVLTVELSSGNAKEITYKAIGTGKATIVVVEGTATKIKNFEITPKALKYTATMDKNYDGTTVATGTITLTGIDAGADVALDIENVTFNFDSKNAGTTNILASQQPILTGSAANNFTLASEVTGKISPKELDVKSVTAYYNGMSVITLADYTAEGLISGDVVPVKATFAANAVGSALSKVEPTTTGDAGNYTLKTGNNPTGTILKSTVVATLPSTASSIDNLKNNIKLAIRETGESVSASTIQFAPTATSDGSGSNTVYYVNGGATSNYSVVYDKNQLGFKSDPTPTPDPVPVTGISLDKTELTLTRLSTYTLIATVAPDNADNKSVKWTSSDESIATVDANGKVTAVKVGKAIITVTTVDGSKTATCQVTVDFATGMEENLANTQIYTRNGMICINPVQPLQATIISMAGKTAYDARISGATQISVGKGVYIVKLTNAGNTITTKVSVH